MMLSKLLKHGVRIAAVAAASVAAQAANATILVDQISPYTGHFVGGSDMGVFTTKLAAQAGGYTIGSVADASQVAAASAIIVVTRNAFLDDDFLSAAERTNISNFLATGKRVLLMGEGFFFDDWNNEILGFASGGTATLGAVVSGSTSPIVVNDLTDGVGSILLQGVGTSSGGSGTQLFGQNFATLWGDNLLTVLDFQVFQDFGAEAFRDNTADWLGASAAIPEPATWAMMIGGFGIIGMAMRRRRRITVSYA